MRYFFESQVEKKEKGYVIRIPFNVWEVCKQRDVIQADVVMDNRIIACELLPREKGNYEIQEGISGIHSDAFYGCKGLSGIVIPDSVSIINTKNSGRR